jgi:hypothetical protein
VNKLVVNVFQVILFAGGSYVAVFVPVPLDDSIYSGDQDVASNVEFSFVVQKGILHILLDEG